MAQIMTVSLDDDLDPAQAADETLVFEIDGERYEIDLSKEHAGELRASLYPYKVAGRRVHPVPRARSGAGRSRASRASSSAVRKWARERGLPVNSRGRIPAEITRQYEEGRSAVLISQ